MLKLYFKPFLITTTFNSMQLLVNSSDSSDSENNPALPFLHLWTDVDGQSHIARSFLSGFGKKSISGDADPQWLRPFPGEVSAILFAVLPVGWVGEWHESPAPQWVIPTKGRWFIETQDGERVEMGPGELHFGQDQNTTPQNGKKGHRSGTVGQEPCYQMIIQFKTSPAANTQHPF